MKITLAILIGLFYFGANAQKSSVHNQSIGDSGILYQDSSVTVLFEKMECSPKMGFDQEVLILTFINVTSEKLKLTWQQILYYNGLCHTCDFPSEYNFELDLNPKSSISGKCDSSDQRLVVFSKFIDSGYKGNAELTAFRMENITVLR